MVLERGPAGGDRPRQHLADGPGQAFGAAPADGGGSAPWRKPCPIEAFAHIDVAKTGHHVLVEEDCLDRPLPAVKPRRDGIPREARFQGVRPHRLEQRVGGEACLDAESAKPEAPGVAKADHRARRDLEIEMVVGSGRRRFAFEDGKPARHAEMLDENGPVLEVPQQILAAPAKCVDALSLETGREGRRQGHAQIPAANDDAGDPPPLEMGPQAKANGLDFRQFRHDPR